MPKRTQYVAFLSGLSMFIVLVWLAKHGGEFLREDLWHSVYDYFDPNSWRMTNAVLFAPPSFVFALAWGYVSLRRVQQWRWEALTCSVAGWGIAQTITSLMGLWATVGDNWSENKILFWFQAYGYLGLNSYPIIFAAPLGLVAATLLMGPLRQNELSPG